MKGRSDEILSVSYEVYYVNDNGILRYHGRYKTYENAEESIRYLCVHEVRIYQIEEQIVSIDYDKEFNNRLKKCDFSITKKLVYVSGSYAASNEYFVLEKHE